MRTMGAFGVVLGARFDRFGGASGIGPDVLWFEFAPPVAMPVLKRFRALVSPTSYRIHSILAEDSLSDPATCRNWATGLFATVAEKYKGDEYGTHMTSREDHSAFELEQRTRSRRIRILCAEEHLSVLYEDRTLHDDARNEHQEWNRVTADFQAGHYATAVPRLAELAAQGNMHSEFLLGYAHRRGLGVDRDDVKAVALYQRAAGKGLPEAQFNLGTYELEGGRFAAAQLWLADILHLATHGDFPDENAANAQSLWLADEGGKSVALSASDVRGLSLPAARLVVLSVCNGGLHRIGPSDEPYGLLPAFLEAGAANVLGTLWPLDDQFGRDFMIEFYCQLPAHGAAGALRRASLRFIGEEEYLCRWAAFVLVGSGRLD